LHIIRQAFKYLFPIIIALYFGNASAGGSMAGGANNKNAIADKMEAKDVLKLTADSMILRQMQTRKYETNDYEKILQSTVGLLQDDGFNIEEIQSDLGVVLGSKNREAVEIGQQVGAVLLALAFGVTIPTDKEQKMNASIVVSEAPSDSNSTIVRVTFSRVVWDTAGQVSKAQRLEEPELYQTFFSRLSKSLFLTEQQI
jgi:hypothetical protein|tara:strand:+ start:219 stop:815 length:597 start_codon:yes stop_codon:yes gene_type:complete